MGDVSGRSTMSMIQVEGRRQLSIGDVSGRLAMSMSMSVHYEVDVDVDVEVRSNNNRCLKCIDVINFAPSSV